MPKFTVKAHWDAEAQVWWAESDDVPGLVAEAETHDALVEDLRQLVPELLELNAPEIDRSSATLAIVSEQAEALRAA